MTTSLEPLPPSLPLPEIQLEVELYPVGTAPPQEDPFALPWWVDVVEWAGDWVIDNILKPGVEAVIEAVAWLEEEIRYWKFKLYEALAELFDDDLGFIFLVAATLAIAIGAPLAIAALKESTLGKVFKDIFQWIKKGTGRIIELTGLVDLIAISQIVEFVWPEWRRLMGSLSEVTSALAGTLGEGTGYLHAWFSAVHGLALVSTSFLGLDPKAAELRAFEETEQFLGHITERLHYYVHEPGEIIRDLIETTFIPYATEIKDAQQDTIESIKTNRERAVELNAVVKDAEGRLNHFIAIQPETLAEVVEKRLGPIATFLGDFVDTFEQQILPGINIAIGALEERADTIERSNASVAAKVDNPLYTLAMYDLMTPTEQALFNRGVMLIASAGLEPELDIVTDGIRYTATPISSALHGFLSVEPRVVIGELPALRHETPGVSTFLLGKSWYQGEY